MMDAAALERTETGGVPEILAGSTRLLRELLTDRLGETVPREAAMLDLTCSPPSWSRTPCSAHVSEAAPSSCAWPRTRSVRSVTDPGDATRPQVQAPDPTVPGGMGLFLVDQISSAWGYERTPDGANRVWFELAA